MARLPYLNEADLSPDDRDLLARPINLHRLLTHSPNAARAFNALGMFIRYESVLDPRLRELAILTVGYVTRSPYEYSHHVKIGQDFGLEEREIAALARYLDGEADAPLGALERLVADAARELTEHPALGDETYAALERHFSSEALVDLVTTIAFYNSVVRVLGAFEIDVEDDYAPYLEAFPLPSDERGGA